MIYSSGQVKSTSQTERKLTESSEKKGKLLFFIIKKKNPDLSVSFFLFFFTWMTYSIMSITESEYFNPPCLFQVRSSVLSLATEINSKVKTVIREMQIILRW